MVRRNLKRCGTKKGATFISRVHYSNGYYGGWDEEREIGVRFDSEYVFLFFRLYRSIRLSLTFGTFKDTIWKRDTFLIFEVFGLEVVTFVRSASVSERIGFRQNPKTKQYSFFFDFWFLQITFGIGVKSEGLFEKSKRKNESFVLASVLGVKKKTVVSICCKLHFLRENYLLKELRNQLMVNIDFSVINKGITSLINKLKIKTIFNELKKLKNILITIYNSI